MIFVLGEVFADPDGTVRGWCWSPDEPAARRSVVVVVDGAPLTVIAGEHDPALAARGIGDGGHAFRFVLPRARAISGETATLRLRDRGTDSWVGAEVTVTWRVATPHAARVKAAEGNLDRVTPDGRVSGWAWRPGSDDPHVSIIVLADGIPAGNVDATELRTDLAVAGIGDGTHGFGFALPWSFLSNRSRLTVSLMDAATRAVIGTPITCRIGPPRPAEERIEDLEREVRLLQATVEQLGQDLRRRTRDNDVSGIFAALAGTFQRAADGADDPGNPAGALRHVLDDLRRRLEPMSLHSPEQADVTICIPATAEAATVHACIAALQGAGADTVAEIMVLGVGAFPDCALLPSIVANLRYLPVQAGQSPAATRATLLAGARGKFLALVSPHVRIAPGWLPAMIGTFAAEPDCAIVGSLLLRRDGLVETAGLVLERGPFLRNLGHLHEPGAPALNFLRPVDAVADAAVMMDRALVASLGVDAPLYRSAAHDLVDLCLRARTAGCRVMVQPQAVAHWAPQSTTADLVADLSTASDDAALLLQRWPGLRQGAFGPAAFSGHALIVAASWSDGLTEFAHALRRSGWRVGAGLTHAVTAQMAALRFAGIDVIGDPGPDVAATWLERHGGEIDLLLLADDAQHAWRSLAPAARLVRLAEAPGPGDDRYDAVWDPRSPPPL